MAKNITLTDTEVVDILSALSDSQRIIEANRQCWAENPKSAARVEFYGKKIQRLQELIEKIKAAPWKN